MHTVMVLGAGLAGLALFVAIGRALGHGARAALLFIPAWLIAAFVNMWIGVTRAGYSWAAETPIFLVVFAIPALIAWLVSKRV